MDGFRSLRASPSPTRDDRALPLGQMNSSFPALVRRSRPTDEGPDPVSILLTACQNAASADLSTQSRCVGKARSTPCGDVA